MEQRIQQEQLHLNSEPVIIQIAPIKPHALQTRQSKEKKPDS